MPGAYDDEYGCHNPGKSWAEAGLDLFAPDKDSSILSLPFRAIGMGFGGLWGMAMDQIPGLNGGYIPTDAHMFEEQKHLHEFKECHALGEAGPQFSPASLEDLGIFGDCSAEGYTPEIDGAPNTSLASDDDLGIFPECGPDGYYPNLSTAPTQCYAPPEEALFSTDEPTMTPAR